MVIDWPDVFPRWVDDTELSVGVSPRLGQNSEQTSAAETKSNRYTVKLLMKEMISQWQAEINKS